MIVNQIRLNYFLKGHLPLLFFRQTLFNQNIDQYTSVHANEKFNVCSCRVLEPPAFYTDRLTKMQLKLNIWHRTIASVLLEFRFLVPCPKSASFVQNSMHFECQQTEQRCTVSQYKKNDKKCMIPGRLCHNQTLYALWTFNMHEYRQLEIF